MRPVNLDTNIGRTGELNSRAFMFPWGQEIRRMSRSAFWSFWRFVHQIKSGRVQNLPASGSK